MLQWRETAAVASLPCSARLVPFAMRQPGLRSAVSAAAAAATTTTVTATSAASVPSTHGVRESPSRRQQRKRDRRKHSQALPVLSQMPSQQELSQPQQQQSASTVTATAPRVVNYGVSKSRYIRIAVSTRPRKGGDATAAVTAALTPAQSPVARCARDVVQLIAARRASIVSCTFRTAADGTALSNAAAAAAVAATALTVTDVSDIADGVVGLAIARSNQISYIYIALSFLPVKFGWTYRLICVESGLLLRQA